MTIYQIGPCPACAEAAADTVATADEVRAELELAWHYHLRRLRPATPILGLHDRLVFSQHPPLQLVQCLCCTLLYRNPRELDDRLVDTYANERLEPATLCRLHAAQSRGFRTQVRRLARCGRPGSVLEVGSYAGGFLAAARRAGWAAEGVDVNALANAFVRDRGLRVHDGTLDDAPRRTYQAVVFWNCFDQLPQPRHALLAARSRLPPGGLLALRVPNGEFYLRWRGRRHGPTGAWAVRALAGNNLLAFPYRHGFTRQALHRLLAVSGFTPARWHGEALLPLADGWTRPWAALEDRLVRGVARRGAPERAPWLEVYAVAS